MSRLNLCLLSLPLITGSSFGASDGPIVDLPTGKVLGRESITYSETKYYAFEKIPYAAPPIGNLRFKSPQPALPWDGVLNTTILDVSCYQRPQSLLSDSEDCLFLNIFTPRLPGENGSLPVMFFIHGGRFTSGSSIFSLPDLFINSGVILVTINYRLGLFGFLSTEDAIIPGNNGLKDQRLAIQWTHDNIHLFGGNPEKITIFGESAGAGSVAFHLLDQSSEGLFQGAILESGSALCPWALQHNSRSNAFNIGTILNSTFTTNNDSQALLEFLQSIDAKSLYEAGEQHVNNVTTLMDIFVFQGSYYGPVVETKNSDAFITKNMYGLLNAGNFIKVPTIIGINSEESLIFNSVPTLLQLTLQAVDDNLDLIVPNSMQIKDSKIHSEVAHQIRDIYTSGEPFGTNLGAGVRYSSDNTFNRGTIKFAELLSKYTKTYLYQFSYDGELGRFVGSIHYDGAENVYHGEETLYIFCSGEDCSFNSYSESDKLTSKRIIKLWTDFAKFQNPTPEDLDLLQNLTWPQVNLENGDFFYLNINETLEIANHPKKETYQKWVDIYDSLDYDDFDTY